MLSDRDILAALKDGSLAIEPFDQKTQLRPAGLTLRLGAEILVPQPTKLIDLRNPPQIEYETHAIDPKTPFILKSQMFVLGHTLELVSVGKTLGFMIEGRSTMARLGVSVEQSATIVDTGVIARPITLEIYNAGPSAVTLYGEMTIARCVVFKLGSESSYGFDERNRYAAQKHGVGRPLL